MAGLCCSKPSEKVDKEMVLKQAVTDAKLWELRFQATERSRESYRESGRRLLLENQQLQDAISQVRLRERERDGFKCVWQTEKDTVKVIGFLKKEGGQREELVGSLQGELEQERERVARERRDMDSHLRGTVGELEDQLLERNEEVSWVLQRRPRPLTSPPSWQ